MVVQCASCSKIESRVERSAMVSVKKISMKNSVVPRMSRFIAGPPFMCIAMRRQPFSVATTTAQKTASRWMSQAADADRGNGEHQQCAVDGQVDIEGGWLVP